MDKTITLNVLIITYNHSKFIEECVLSAINQKTDFPYKIIIGDDFSNDGTREILIKLKEKYHEKLDLILHPRRLIIKELPEMFGKLNFISTFKRCTNSKYIATLDGDDYWTDPYKLQKQVDFLENNEDYAICFHRVHDLVEGQEPVLSNLNTSDLEETYTIFDLAKGNIIHTPSVMFRTYPDFKLPSWFKDCAAGDYVLHMLNANFGKIKYLPESMAVYRKHEQGIWSSKSKVYQNENWIKVLDYLIFEFKEQKIKNILSFQKANVQYRLAMEYLNQENHDVHKFWLYQAFSSSYEFYIEWINNNFNLIQIVNNNSNSIYNKLKTVMQVILKRVK